MADTIRLLAELQALLADNAAGLISAQDIRDFLVSAIPGGRGPTLVVAASSATNKRKAAADFVCDGVADDADIQDAIDALPAGGGSIELTEGQFNISATILHNKQKVTIKGQGEATILRLDDNIDDFLIKAILTTGNSGVLRDFAVQGNAANNASVDGMVRIEADEFWCDNLFVDDVTGSGMEYKGTADHGEITNCRFTNCSGFGCRPSGAARYLVVGFNHFQNNGNHGLSIDDRNITTTVIGNVSDNNVGTGIWVEGQCRGIAVVGNSCSENGQSGIWMLSNSDVVPNFGNTITGNTCRLNGEAGIALIGGSVFTNELVEDIVVSSNIVLDNDQDAGNFAGILISVNIHRVQVFGNRSGNAEGATQNYGIELESTRGVHTGDVTDIDIYHNDFRNNATAGFTNTGAGNTWTMHHNRGWVTEGSGTGSIASGTTSDVITHGLDVTPTIEDITVTLAENPTNDPGNQWVDTFTATTFKFNCRADPGASNLDFGWKAGVTRTSP